MTKKNTSNIEYALPSKKMFPINDEKHIRLAWDMVKRAKNLTDAERETSRKNILTAAKKAGIDTSDWDKKEMTDMIVSEVKVLTDSAELDSAPLRVRFKGTKVNVVNDNNRLYPNNVMADGIVRAIKSYVHPGKMVGETPHPKSFKGKNGQVVFDTKMENSVIKVENLFMDNGEVFLDAEVLETTKGKDLKALIKQGVPVGISMRALGDSIKRIIEGRTVDVATFLDIQSFDVVMNPATEGCGVVQVLTDSQIAEIIDTDPVIEDGIQHTNPVCPSCNAELTPVDPDGDGDIDFYECPDGCGIFFADNYLTSSINASTELRKMNTSDYDRYSLAQNYLVNKPKAGAATVTDSVPIIEKTTDVTPNTEQKTVTDSNLEGDDIVNVNDLLKAIKENPEIQSALTGIATQVAKPALDSVEAQKLEEQKSQAKLEAKAFVDEKIAALKGKMDDKVIKVITDSLGEPENKEQAQVVLDAALKLINDASAAQILANLGFDGVNNGDGGRTTIEMTNTAKPWLDHVEKLTKAFDEYGTQFGKVPDESIRKYNKKFVDKILEKYEAQNGKVLTDGVQAFENLSDSASVTTAQLLNQPTILTAVLIQAFQDVESLQFLMADTFEGSEWRIPVETFVSAATQNTSTGLLDILVPENMGIPESSINLAWQSYNPSWRRNAVSLTTDVVNQLKSGPAKYEAIARAIYHIGEDKKRKLDNAAYYEMILASDEYAPLSISGETAASVTAVSNGTNVTYKYSLTGKGALTSTAGTNPIVRPRTKNVIQPNGQIQQVTTNSFTVTVASSALTLGYLDSNGNIAGTNAQYAVDWENGVIYFNAASGVDATHLPTISYSAVTNYDRWIYTVPNGMKAEDYYNTFLQKLTNVSAVMGSAPRYKKPNLALFSLNSATYVENASIFYKLASPDGTKLIPTSNSFGERNGMNLSKINAPWIVGDGRVLLTQKGSTRYGVETPYVIEGPFPKYDSNGNIIDAKVWYGRENSVLCTPQVTDTNGNIINPVSRTIKMTT